MFLRCDIWLKRNPHGGRIHNDPRAPIGVRSLEQTGQSAPAAEHPRVPPPTSAGPVGAPERVAGSRPPDALGVSTVAWAAHFNARVADRHTLMQRRPASLGESRANTAEASGVLARRQRRAEDAKGSDTHTSVPLLTFKSLLLVSRSLEGAPSVAELEQGNGNPANALECPLALPS